VPPELLPWLAEHLTAGGRQLEAALRQITTLCGVGRCRPTVKQLQEHFRPQVEAQRPTVERIVAHVGDYFHVEPRQLKSARRTRDLLMPRQVSMYLARKLTPLSLKEIGRYFGGRDYTTVRHACRKVESALAADPVLCGAVERLHQELG